MNFTDQQISNAQEVYDNMFRVREHTGAGWIDHFYQTYDKAYKMAEIFIRDYDAESVEIKSPGGDYVRTFKAGIVEVK